MEYRVVNQGLSGTRKLFPISDNIYKHITNTSKDWYTSIFQYSEEHFNKLKETGSLAGSTGLKTEYLVFDLDSKANIEKAKEDALTLCNRLLKLGVPEKGINICFSGSKGFSITIKTNKLLTFDEFASIHQNLTEGLETNDTTVVDQQRIFRVPGTRHQVTGLYKFPLTLQELKDIAIGTIKNGAEDINNTSIQYKDTEVVDLPQSIYKLKDIKPKIVIPKIIMDVSELNFLNKPKGFSNCKYAILEGFFPEGYRNNALMALAATCKSLGYSKDITWNMCKASVRLQAARFGETPFDKKELWENVVEQIFRPTWDGGSYSCRKEGHLRDFCQTLGRNSCKHNEDSTTIQTKDVFNIFEDYALNYDKNVLNTGIKQLDEKCKFLVGTSSAILAPPGVGKTSISLSILNNTSKQGVHSIFYSFDMFSSMVYLRLCQKHTGYTQEKLFSLFKNKDKEVFKLKEILEEEYKNVNFCFKSGQSADEVEETLLDTEQKIGDKVKLIIVDYNELVIASVNDPTQASAQTAQRLRQIANDRQTTSITLLQPSKLFSDPSEEAKTYQAAKGSGAIAQSLTLMLGLSRPGFSPRNPEQDKFVTINALKNRNGPLFTVDMGWDGLTGSITELNDEDLYELKQIREKKKLEDDSEMRF